MFLFSCRKSNEPLSKEKNYNVNITYIEDEAIQGFRPKDFLDIFDDDLSKLTYDILGYKIKYDLKNGVSSDDFYRVNRKIILNNGAVFRRNFIDIKNISYNELSKYILSFTSLNV